MVRINKEVAPISIALTEPSNNSENNSTGSTSRNVFFVPYFNLIFYIGFFPFKTEYDQIQDKYVVKTYKIQQILCALNHISCLFFMTFYITSDFLKVMDNTPANNHGASLNIFDIGSNFGTVATLTFVAHMSWFRRNVFLEVVERTRENTWSTKRLRQTSISVYCATIVVIIFFGIIDWIIVSQNFTVEMHLVPKDLTKSFNKSTDGNYLKVFEKVEITKDGILMNYGKRIVAFCVIFIYSYLITFYSIAQTIFMIVTLTLRQAGVDFRRKLREQGYADDGLEQGILLYKNLKETSELIRVLCGNALIGYYISAVAYVAEAPHVLLGDRPEIERLIMIYSILSSVVWILAAEFHDNVRNDLLKWTEYHLEKSDILIDRRLTLLSMAGEISSNKTTTVALCSKCFAVTYKHLGSMLSLIVTYGIIVFQLHYAKV